MPGDRSWVPPRELTRVTAGCWLGYSGSQSILSDIRNSPYVKCSVFPVNHARARLCRLSDARRRVSRKPRHHASSTVLEQLIELRARRRAGKAVEAALSERLCRLHEATPRRA